jgi:hypothetical protein
LIALQAETQRALKALLPLQEIGFSQKPFTLLQG